MPYNPFPAATQSLAVDLVPRWIPLELPPVCPIAMHSTIFDEVPLVIPVPAHPRTSHPSAVPPSPSAMPVLPPAETRTFSTCISVHVVVVAATVTPSQPRRLPLRIVAFLCALITRTPEVAAPPGPV